VRKWEIKLRRGEGPFWGTLKRIIQRVAYGHLPIFWLSRPLFRAVNLARLVCSGLWNWAVRFFWSEPLFRCQCESVGARFVMGPLPYIHGVGRIVLGERVTLGGKPDIVFGNRAGGIPELVIGDRVFIGHQCSFAISASVRIGNDCLLAGSVHVSDYDGHPTDARRRRAGDVTPTEAIRPVVIGDDVWIGNHATILKGVTIGDRSIVGTQAVVTRDVPPDVVVAGNPARVVKHLVDEQAQPRQPSEEERRLLLAETGEGAA
jgi:acetyltransferase-like isoleucine patch superfamily enzyme